MDNENNGYLESLEAIVSFRNSVPKRELYYTANDIINKQYVSGNETLDKIKDLFNDVKVDCTTKYDRCLDRIQLVLNEKGVEDIG